MPRLSALGATWAAAATVASPGLRLMLRMRQSRGKELPGRLRERRGIDPTPRPPGRLIWLHAASVGETVSILPVLPALVEHATVLLTTGTVTSARLLAQRLDAKLARRVIHRFVPLDVPAWGRRFLDHWQPDAAGFVESELWPNLLAACRTRGVPVMLINARLSARSQARWQRGRALARQMLSGLALVQPRSATDAQRLLALGCRTMTEPADLKFAAPPLPVDEAELARMREVLAGRPVWLAASTHPGEDELVIAAHEVLVRTHAGLLTIIAPRHPERGPGISENHLRSRGDPPPAEGVWIADTLGELGLWYRLAPIVFVGRSLIAPGGGQNPLEPARLGCAVAVGPHTGNFADHIAALHAAGALAVVRDVDQLARWVDELLRDATARQAMGDAGRAIVQRHSDLPERTAAALLGLAGLSSASPCGLGPRSGTRPKAGEEGGRGDAGARSSRK
jgi:3-deoxy-D-manno-octulosonic-acid transferase